MGKSIISKSLVLILVLMVVKTSEAQQANRKGTDGCLSITTLQALIHLSAEDEAWDILETENYSIGSSGSDTIVDTVDYFPLKYKRTGFYYEGGFGDEAEVMVMESLDGLSNYVQFTRKIGGKCDLRKELRINGYSYDKIKSEGTGASVYVGSVVHGASIEKYEFTVVQDSDGFFVTCKFVEEIEEYIGRKKKEASEYIAGELVKARQLASESQYEKSLRVMDSLIGYYPPLDDTVRYWTGKVMKQRIAYYHTRLNELLEQKKEYDALGVCDTILQLDPIDRETTEVRDLLKDRLNRTVKLYREQRPETYKLLLKELQDVVNKEIRQNLSKNTQRIELDFHIQTDTSNESSGKIVLSPSKPEGKAAPGRSRGELLQSSIDSIAHASCITPVVEHGINIRTEDDIEANVSWFFETREFDGSTVKDSVMNQIINTIERQYMYESKISKTELEADGSLKEILIPRLPTKRKYTFGWINKELTGEDTVSHFKDIVLVDFKTARGASWMPSLFVPGLGTYGQDATSSVAARAVPFFLFAGISAFGFLWEKYCTHERYEISNDYVQNPLYYKNVGYFLGYGGLGLSAVIYINELSEAIGNSIKNAKRSRKLRERLAQEPIWIERQDVILH